MSPNSSSWHLHRKVSLTGLIGCTAFWLIWTADQWLPFQLADTYPEIQEFGLLVAIPLGFIAPVLVMIAIYGYIKLKIFTDILLWLAVAGAIPTLLWNGAFLLYAWLWAGY